MKSAAWVVIAVVVVNVLLRLLPLPHVELPAVSIPDLPDWLGTVNRVRNWLTVAGVAVIVLAAVARAHRPRPPGAVAQPVGDGRDEQGTDSESAGR